MQFLFCFVIDLLDTRRESSERQAECRETRHGRQSHKAAPNEKKKQRVFGLLGLLLPYPAIPVSVVGTAITPKASHTTAKNQESQSNNLKERGGER
jgi:hypothetical protein